MSAASPDQINTCMRRAITEIKGLITSRYPGTTFAVTRSVDPPGIRVLAPVDVDDIDEVLDLYIHRLTQLQVEDGLPLSVVPVPARSGRHCGARFWAAA